MDERRAKRLASNEALFRHANEALRKSDDTVISIAGFLCECSDADCEKKIEVPGDVYIGVRENAMRFIIARGHAKPEIERLVDDPGDFQIVEKLGPGRDVAERLAPRKPSEE
jgi:hypothetical protein